MVYFDISHTRSLIPDKLGEDAWEKLSNQEVAPEMDLRVSSLQNTWN